MLLANNFETPPAPALAPALTPALAPALYFLLLPLLLLSIKTFIQ